MSKSLANMWQAFWEPVYFGSGGRGEGACNLLDITFWLLKLSKSTQDSCQSLRWRCSLSTRIHMSNVPCQTMRNKHQSDFVSTLESSSTGSFKTELGDIKCVRVFTSEVRPSENLHTIKEAWYADMRGWVCWAAYRLGGKVLWVHGENLWMKCWSGTLWTYTAAGSKSRWVFCLKVGWIESARIVKLDVSWSIVLSIYTAWMTLDLVYIWRLLFNYLSYEQHSLQIHTRGVDYSVLTLHDDQARCVWAEGEGTYSTYRSSLSTSLPQGNPKQVTSFHLRIYILPIIPSRLCSQPFTLQICNSWLSQSSSSCSSWLRPVALWLPLASPRRGTKAIGILNTSVRKVSQFPTSSITACPTILLFSRVWLFWVLLSSDTGFGGKKPKRALADQQFVSPFLFLSTIGFISQAWTLMDSCVWFTFKTPDQQAKRS